MSSPEPPFSAHEIVRPGETIVGARHLSEDDLDRPVGVGLVGLAPGPLSAHVSVHNAAIRWATDGGLATPDRFGSLAPAGTAIDVHDAHGLRLVGAEPGASATVTLKRPASSR